ncbi:polysaccharide biosynthesis protein [Filobacillus milosensis]|nr:polysaccharide biosynthesis protein [Filobacillus milosensis]
MSQQALWVRGAIFLTIAGFISKVLGMIYRVPLQNMAGDEGLYIYQQIYPILSVALLLSIYSIPSAISQIGSNRKSTASNHVPHEWMVFSILFGLGVALFLGFYFFSDLFAQWMGDPNLNGSIQVAGAMFLLIPLSSTLRGVFQSVNLPQYIAISQIIEQFIRVVLIIVMTYWIIQYTNLSVYQIGSYAAWSTIIGTMVACIMLIGLYFWKRRTIKFHRFKLNRSLTQVLLIGVAIYSLIYMMHLVLQVVDVFTMVELLQQFGFSFEEAKSMKGIFDRSHPIIQMGLVIGSSLALALIPTLGQNHLRMELAFKWTFLLSLGASIGLIAIMPLMNPLLFKTNDGTAALQWMMLIVFLLSMIIMLSVFLQQYNYRLQQLKWILIMIGIKYILNLILIPKFGIIGSSWAYIGAAAFLLCVFLWKWKVISEINASILFIIKSIFILLVMWGVVTFTQSTLTDYVIEPSRLTLAILTLILCILGVIIVGIGLFVLKLFNQQDLKELKGN